MRFLLVVLLLISLFPEPLVAQSPGRSASPGTVVALRVGLSATTPLARDPIASAVPFQVRDKVQGVTVRQSVAPLLGVGIRQRLAGRMEVELEGAWTFATMQADDGVQRWTLQDLGVGQASLSVLRRVGSATQLRAGVGAVRYASEGRWPMEDRGVIEPTLVLGLGQRLRVAALPAVSVELVGHAHSMDAPPGGTPGTVFRAGVQGAFDLGGVR